MLEIRSKVDGSFRINSPFVLSAHFDELVTSLVVSLIGFFLVKTVPNAVKRNLFVSFFFILFFSRFLLFRQRRGVEKGNGVKLKRYFLGFSSKASVILFKYAVRIIWVGIRTRRYGGSWYLRREEGVFPHEINVYAARRRKWVGD